MRHLPTSMCQREAADGSGDNDYTCHAFLTAL